MTFVVDASVAVKWFVEEDHAAEARQLLTAGEAVAAPDFVLAELGSLVWRYRRGDVASAAQVQATMAEARSLFDVLVPLNEVVDRGVTIAVEVDHQPHDCLYLATAERLAGRLITADRKFVLRLKDTRWAEMVAAFPTPS